MSGAVFDVESTNAVKEDKLDVFLNCTLEPELNSIPLIGPASVTALNAVGIQNSVSPSPTAKCEA